MPSNYLPDTNQTPAEFNQSRDFTVSQCGPATSKNSPEDK